MENVPTSHTDSYLAGYSKGPLTDLFCRPWYLLSLPLNSQVQVSPSWPGSVMSRGRGEGRGPSQCRPCPWAGHPSSPVCRFPTPQDRRLKAPPWPSEASSSRKDVAWRRPSAQTLGQSQTLQRLQTDICGVRVPSQSKVLNRGEELCG